MAIRKSAQELLLETRTELQRNLRDIAMQIRELDVIIHRGDRAYVSAPIDIGIVRSSLNAAGDRIKPLSPTGITRRITGSKGMNPNANTANLALIDIIGHGPPSGSSAEYLLEQMEKRSLRIYGAVPKAVLVHRLTREPTLFYRTDSGKWRLVPAADTEVGQRC